MKEKIIKPQRSYTPLYMREGYVSEATRQAQRRLDPELKPIDAMLILWAPEARYDGAPRLPAETILKKLIEEGPGAGHQGSRAQLPRALHIEFADWAVSVMPAVNRLVIFAEYVWHPGWPAERKSRQIGMSHSTWDKTLKAGRVSVLTLLNAFGFKLPEKIV